MPMHDRVDADRQLTFPFVLGGGLRSWRAIGPTRPRIVGVAQSRRRQHSQRWPDEQEFRSDAEHQLDVGRSAVPRLRASSRLFHKPTALVTRNNGLAATGKEDASRRAPEGLRGIHATDLCRRGAVLLALDHKQFPVRHLCETASVYSTSRAPAARRARVAGGAEEPLLARRVRRANADVTMHMQLYADDGHARDPCGSHFACESSCARPNRAYALSELGRPKRQRRRL